MKPPSIEELFLNPERRRVLGYPVLTFDEISAFIATGIPANYSSIFGRTIQVYGLPALAEPQAAALESAIKTLSMFLTKEQFPERVAVGLQVAWKDEVNP
jgi:hypothetical protein